MKLPQSILKRIFFLITVSTFFVNAHAQNFSYSVSTDSVSWNELSSQTILNSGNAAWNFSYKIPIGFSFNYLGRNFDSLTIETNGYLVFDADRNYAFTAFNGLGDRIDSSGNHAVLGYEVSGSSGNHILKIQYKNTGTDLHDTRKQSWQTWLKENGGAVEVHVGPGDFRTYPTEVTATDSVVTTDSLSNTYVTYFDTTYTVTTLDTAQHCRIGLLNQNMNTELRGFFLGGNASSPSGYPVNDENPDCAVMNYFPAEGYRYTFTPDNN